MFKVKNINGSLPNKIYTVYHIRDNHNGYPHFLIYFNNQWLYVSAKYFKPIEEEK